MNRNYFPVIFYRTETGVEPVRDWLKDLNNQERKIIGEDIKTVQFGWPLGMSLIKKIEPGLWEVRSGLIGKISRVIFTVREEKIILLHGFIKKTQKLRDDDLDMARRRLGNLKRGKT